MNIKLWTIIAAVVLAAIIIIGGLFYYTNRAIAPEKPNAYNETSTSPTTTTPITSSTTAKINYPSLDPTSGPVGTTVTIHNKNFGSANTIEMSGLVGPLMKNVASADGATLQFTIPATIGPNCHTNQACPQFLAEVTPRAYTITVVTNGTSTMIGTFTVTVR